MKRISRLLAPAIAVASLTFAKTDALAGPVTLNASADTMITEHIGLGGIFSNHSNRTNLWNIANYASNRVATYPMVRFDLGAYAGQSLTGDATFQLYLFGPQSPQFFHASPRTVRVGEITKAWDPTTVTFNSFGVTPGVEPPDVDWAAAAHRDIFWTGVQQGYVQWTIAQTVVQSWIDNPASNHGLMVDNFLPKGIDNWDLLFASLEHSIDRPGQLLFTTSMSVVPEPGSLVAIVGFLGTVVAHRRRRRN